MAGSIDAILRAKHIALPKVASPVGSYVNLEGDAVWTQEYLRLRVNGCTHANAVQSVFSEIAGTAPICH